MTPAPQRPSSSPATPLSPGLLLWLFPPLGSPHPRCLSAEGLGCLTCLLAGDWFPGLHGEHSAPGTHSPQPPHLRLPHESVDVEFLGKGKTPLKALGVSGQRHPTTPSLAKGPAGPLLLLAAGVSGASPAPARVGGPSCRPGPWVSAGAQAALPPPLPHAHCLGLWLGLPGLQSAPSGTQGPRRQRAQLEGLLGEDWAGAPQDQPGGVLGPPPPLWPQAAAVPRLPANTGLCIWSLVWGRGGTADPWKEGRKEAGIWPQA